MNKNDYHTIREREYNFKPGVCPNPKGRGIGSLSKRTKEYLKVKQLAADNYERMFEILLEKGLRGEPWAQQLYYKEFIPRRAKQETVVLVGMEDNNISSQIKSLTEALIKFDQVTQEELIERLKTLAALKLTDSVEQQNTEIKETKMTLMEKVEKLEYLIDLKKKSTFNKEEDNE